MAILYDTEATLRERAEKCIADDFKHQAIENAQETFYNKRAALVAEQPDWEGLRQTAADIRNHVTANLDYYVRQFAKNAQAHGVNVHFAPTDVDALLEILDVFADHGAAKAVKSKSMMTEEIGLNEILEEAGVEVIETDCAENILQVAGDRPSHIVVPALHHTREDIAELYREKKGYEGDTVPENITHFLRGMLREEFLTANVGIRGCNFAVAETGSVTLVTNEGNGRMVDTFPPVQVVLIGIDRIVPDLAALDIFMSLLPRSAVGAKMTSYFSVDTGTRRENEVDGPAEVHYIIMDNGRHELLDTEFEPMLRCIRCGACLNICPVYRHITGHGYGSIYPGPMGIVLTAALEGYEQIDGLAFACTLCGACAEHCPAKIPLADLIREHRVNMVDQGYVHKSEKPMFVAAEKMWSSVGMYRRLMKAGRFGMKALATGGSALDKKSAWIPVLNGWTGNRDMPVLAEYRFRDWLAEHNETKAAFEESESGPSNDEAESRRGLGKFPRVGKRFVIRSKSGGRRA